MLGMKSGAIALGAMLLMGLGGVEAQDAPARRGPGMHGAGGPEMVLSMRDQLGLTEEQIAELDELREQMVGIRTSHRSAMASVRSRFEAGEIDREEMTTAMEAIRSGGPQVHEEMQSRIASILDEEQLASFEELRQSRQAVRDGRGMRRGGGPGAMGGQGMRGDGPRGMGPDAMRPGGRGPRGGPGGHMRGCPGPGATGAAPDS
jgi:Spy/CpxP family protein refolding chaperone